MPSPKKSELNSVKDSVRINQVLAVRAFLLGGDTVISACKKVGISKRQYLYWSPRVTSVIETDTINTDMLEILNRTIIELKRRINNYDVISNLTINELLSVIKVLSPYMEKKDSGKSGYIEENFKESPLFLSDNNDREKDSENDKPDDDDIEFELD